MIDDVWAKDEFGFPGAVGLDGEFDGGDTASIIGTILSLDPNPNELMTKLHFLIPEGIPIRHPNWHRWYGRPDRFSRDQLIPMICTGIRYDGFVGVIDLFFDAHKKHWFLKAWNSRKNGVIDVLLKKRPLGIFPREDITGPEVWALWIRYKKPRWRRLILWFLDLELFFGAIKWRLKPRNNITRNHMLSSIICRKYSPTWVSRWAYWINNWPDLLGRWYRHLGNTNEYDTFMLFAEAVKAINDKKGF